MWYYFLIAGLFSGICGGMGLGGGTLLIPILTLFLGIEQHIAQGLNLLVFIPTAIIALIIHIKNKLLNWKIAILIGIPAIATAIMSSLYVKEVSSDTLKLVFGIFLIVLACCELTKAIKETISQAKLIKAYKYKI